jgi:hypothetical protein
MYLEAGKSASALPQAVILVLTCVLFRNNKRSSCNKYGAHRTNVQKEKIFPQRSGRGQGGNDALHVALASQRGYGPALGRCGARHLSF